MSQQSLFNSAVFALAVLGSGCTTIYSMGPKAYVESPEVLHSEMGQGAIVIRAEPAHNIQLVKDASARPLTITNPPDLTSKTFVMSGLHWTLGHQFEINLTGYPIAFLNGFGLSWRAGLKWQFLGDPANNTESVGHRAAFFGHLAYTSLSEKGDQNELFGPGGYPWSATSQFRGSDLGLSYGYRRSRGQLYYLGAGYQVFDVSAHIHQDPSQAGDFPAADVQLPLTSGVSATGTVGLQWGVNNIFHIYYSYSSTKWTSLTEYSHFVGIGVQMDTFKKALPPLKPSI